MRSDLVKCGERVDDLQNGLFVIQDPKKFCFGMDAVLLSGFARVKKGEVALDMGTGTGIIPILLSDRTDGEHFTGLEIQHECAEMADRSVRFNGLEDRVRIVEGDIKSRIRWNGRWWFKPGFILRYFDRWLNCVLGQALLVWLGGMAVELRDGERQALHAGKCSACGASLLPSKVKQCARWQMK